jgi:hypothetical protein
MRRSISQSFWTGLVLVGIWLPGSPAVAQDVVAVLSSDSSAYREALAGFEEGYGHPVLTFTLSKGDIHIPSSTKVVIAFGGKAAIHSYPADTTIVYCLTPALWVGPEQHAGLRIRIFVAPQPESLISGLKEIQPGLKQLGIFEMSSIPSKISYFDDFGRAAKAGGLQVRIEYLDRLEDLPDRLRLLKQKVNAIWLPPNPLLITPGSFAIIKEFGSSNNVPFYAPMENLVDKGATAFIGYSFREMGRKAAQVTTRVLAGDLNENVKIYPEKIRMVLNLTAAAQAGLTIPPGVVKKADRVVP